MGDEQQVLALLDKLEGQVKESTTIIEKEKSGTLTAITNVRTDLSNNSSKPSPEDIANLVDSLTVITDNIKNFTSKDPIKISQGVLNIIGGIGAVVAGPYGPLVAAGCGLVSSVLTLFGGGGPTLAEQLEEIIDQALEDYKDQEVIEDIKTSVLNMRTLITQMVGMARYNGGIVTEGEKSFFTEADIILCGNKTLAVLTKQLENYKTDNNDDSKCKSLAGYTFSYANICIYKNILLNIHIGLLRRNEMESMANGVVDYLTQELPSQGRGVLGFMSSLPDPKECYYWRVFRYLHTSLDVSQRFILTTYRKMIALEPIPGVLCCLYNTSRSGYAFLYSGSASVYDEKRHYFLRNGNGGAFSQSLFYIVGEDNDHKHIFSVWCGEYIYAASSGYNNDRRYVLSWRPGGISEIEEATWEFKGDWAEDCTIKNFKYGEYLYSATIDAGDGMVHNFCWEPGNADYDAHWQIKELAYETTLNLEKPMGEN